MNPTQQIRATAPGAGRDARVDATLPLATRLAPLEDVIASLWGEMLIAAPERRRFLVTGVSDGDGVTTVAAAAALGMARHLRRRTLLIETNVYRPGLARILGSDGPGFSEFCRGEFAVQSAIRPTDTELLDAMTAGNSAVGAGVFAEPGASELLDGLGRVYERIVLDAAPVLAHPDTLLLARECDASILVARAHDSRASAVREASEKLRATGVPLIGTVLNQVRRRTPGWLEKRRKSPDVQG